MPLKNILAKKEKPAEKAASKKQSSSAVSKGDSKTKNPSVLAERTLIRPHVTEKAVKSAEHGTYVFDVFANSTKHQVKESVESVFGVKVTGVRMAASRIKNVRRRSGIGKKTIAKKAIVQVKKGDHIEFASL
ncbi:MAG: 50S ribosomal protein L23 [Candidatus Yanofskybacteria bacterium]|nr:50S ribosomal protein L23 [Candidatus Yanofskybacteria bacterium]